jgi:hypothetical protein
MTKSVTHGGTATRPLRKTAISVAINSTTPLDVSVRCQPKAQRLNRTASPPILRQGRSVSKTNQYADHYLTALSPIPAVEELPRTGEWVIAFTESFRTVACLREGAWWDLIHRTKISSVVAWVPIRKSQKNGTN